MRKYAAMYDIDGYPFVRLFDADDTAHAAEQAEDACDEGESFIAVRPFPPEREGMSDNAIVLAMLDGRI